MKPYPGILAAVAVSITCLLPCGTTADSGFIPLEDLFRDADHARVILSPDGKYLAGSRWEEVRRDDWQEITFSINLDTRDATVLNDGREQNIRTVSFVSDSRLILGYLRGTLWSGSRWLTGEGGWRTVDAGGDNLLELIPTESRAQTSRVPNRDLVFASHLYSLPDDPDHAVMAMFSYRPYNSMIMRSRGRYPFPPAEGGLFRVNVRNAETRRIATDTKTTINWWLDAEGEPALAMAVPTARVDRYGAIVDRDWRQTLPRRLFLVEGGEPAAPLPLELGTVAEDLPLVFASPFFAPERKRLYFRSQMHTDTVAVVAMDLDSFDVEVVHEHPEADIEAVYLDRFTRELIGYRIGKGRGSFIYVDDELAALARRIDAALPDSVNQIVSYDRDRRRFLIRSFTTDFPVLKYILDLDRGSLEEVYNPAPWLSEYTFSPMEPVEFDARDGVRIHGYLTKPHRADPGARHPLILLVHGGPWLRDNWAFSTQVQFLADRGYAVLQVNFRGSLGYGFRFMELSKRQFGKAMQDDLTDAVRWAVDEGIADPDRIGIMGASYGGYAAMAGLAFTPELYRVGISLVGVFDLTRQISDYRHYGFDFAHEFWVNWVGDATDDRAALRAVSPMFHTDRIRAPVFLYHGYRDGQARINQAFEFSRALERSGVDVTRDFRRNEGHGIFEEDNRIDVYRKLEAFLRKQMPSDLMKTE
ncbi:MAG: S9 family peptidase [Opitutales bacterium]|nr:S9 family peptidase [Opitutales bacterium]